MNDRPSLESQELFNLIVENVKDYAIFATDAEGRVVSWNPGVKRLLGYDEAEIVGQTVAVIFTPEDREGGAHLREMEKAARVLIGSMLEHYGAHVTAVTSAGAALEWLAGSKPDVIISDVGLPDEDGLSFMRKVRAREAGGGGRTPAVAPQPMPGRKTVHERSSLASRCTWRSRSSRWSWRPSWRASPGAPGSSEMPRVETKGNHMPQKKSARAKPSAKTKRAAPAGAESSVEKAAKRARATSQQSSRKPRPTSAGGLEAFRQLLDHLPVDTGMASVLVQHLDPTHKSILTELLARSTEIPVSEVGDGMKVEPDHVYVIPPNTGMGISGGTGCARGRRAPRPSYSSSRWFAPSSST